MVEQDRAHSKLGTIPVIPNKRFFTIGETSELCAVKPHVLRYWEQEFRQLRPSKRRGNRRFYSYHDVQLVRTIRELLYEQGFTIEGARKQLAVFRGQTKEQSVAEPSKSLITNLIQELNSILRDLR